MMAFGGSFGQTQWEGLAVSRIDQSLGFVKDVDRDQVECAEQSIRCQLEERHSRKKVMENANDLEDYLWTSIWRRCALRVRLAV